MTRTKVITFLSFMISISVILQYIEISIPILPSFLKLDFSDVPQILTTALLGPWMGILVSLCKNGIHLFLSQSGFIGELSNFILGASFCLIFGYIWPHSKKAGILLACIFMAFMSYYSNYYLIYPLYYKVGFSKSAILSMYQLIVPSIQNLSQALLFFNVPFTFIKGFLNTGIFLLIFSRIRHLSRL